jgi:hypothetical protein
MRPRISSPRRSGRGEDLRRSTRCSSLTSRHAVCPSWAPRRIPRQRSCDRSSADAHDGGRGDVWHADLRSGCEVERELPKAVAFIVSTPRWTAQLLQARRLTNGSWPLADRCDKTRSMAADYSLRSSRASHALANRQSRITVCGEM